MPYSTTDPNKYERKLYDIIYAAIESPITLHFENKGKAINFRHKLHAFREALRYTSDPRYMTSMEVEVSIKDNTATVRKAGTGLEEALQREVPPAPKTEEEKLAEEKLLKLQASLDEAEQGLPAKRETMEDIIARTYGPKEGESPFSAFGDLLKKPGAEGK